RPRPAPAVPTRRRRRPRRHLPLPVHRRGAARRHRHRPRRRVHRHRGPPRRRRPARHRGRRHLARVPRWARGPRRRPAAPSHPTPRVTRPAARLRPLLPHLNGTTMPATAFADRYGPTALVTGASSGIGRALAWEAARRGLDVVLVARRAAALRELADDVSSRHGVRAEVRVHDLADPAAPARLAEETADRDIGLLIAAAGFGTSGTLAEAPLAAEREMLQVNCGAVVELAATLGARMVYRGRGGIVLLSSIVAFQGAPNAAHYAATKAYVQTLAEGLQVELAPRGVDVLAAAPGPVASG